MVQSVLVHDAEQQLFSIWLNKVYDEISFEDFKKQNLNLEKEEEKPTDEQLGDIVKNSASILDNFIME